MHYIIKYNRSIGTVVNVKEFMDWKKAFDQHLLDMSEETNPNISVSLVDAPSINELKKLYGAFFHK